MPKKASIAKITRPLLLKVLPRTRLFSLLDKGRYTPVTWVSGPAGSGKTTLVASYVDARKLPCLWYQIDEGDNDIATFFYYLGLAVRKASHRCKTSLPSLTTEYMSDVAAFTRRYFESAYLRLNPQARPSSKGNTTRFVIVLDNYHHIQTGSPFHNMIREALFVIPEGISMMIISRSVPPPALALFLTYQKIHCIGWDELKFDKKETGSLLRSGRNRTMRGPTVEQLHRMTTGWAAGVVLLMERLRTSNLSDQDTCQFKSGEMFDYFATELFDKTDKGMQAFLLRTSFLPLITPHAAARLTGMNDAGGVLAKLNSNHFFTELRSVSDPVYQYHPLFREFLLAHARETYSCKEIVDIMSRAASLLEEAGMVEDAAELYQSSEKWEGIVRLVLANAKSMVAQGRTRPLEEWLKNLPLKILNSEPWLLYWMGVCSMPFHLAEGRRHFEKSLIIFRKQRDIKGIYLAWSGAVEAIFQEMGDIRRLESWIELFEEIGKEYGFPPPEIEAQVTVRVFTALRWRRENPAFIRWSKKALELMDSDEDASLRMLTGFYLFSFHAWWAGDYTIGRRVLDVMKRIAKMERDLPPLVQTMQKAAESLFAMLHGAHEYCLNVVSEGLTISGESGVHLWDGVLLMSAAGSCLCACDLTKAGQFLDKLGFSLEGIRPFDRFYYYHMSAWRFMLMNDISQAVVYEHTALDLASETGFEIAEAQGHFVMAHLMRAAGERKSAEEHILLCGKIGCRMGSAIVEFMTLLSEAAFAFDRKDEKAGVSNLKAAMALGKTNGYVYFCGWHASLMVPLCLKALEEGIEIDYVKGLVRTCKMFSENPPLQIEAWPWPIKIYTLGRFEIVINGKPLLFTGKVQKKPLEMLKGLIAMGVTDVSEHQILDTLWPDSDGDAARIAFKTALHRLRKLLGGEEFIQLQGGRMSLDQRHCWVDAAAFERMLELAEVAMRDTKQQINKQSLIQNQQSKRRILLLKKAMDLYCGHFLSTDGDKLQSNFLKERLRRKYIRLVNILGMSQLAQNERTSINKAIEYFERGLEIDDVAEELYQNLMICYQKIGSKAEAVKLYRRCCDTLSAALGVEPSKKTERIYKEIRQGL